MSAAGIWMLGLSAAAWLAVGSLAAWGARRRGQRWDVRDDAAEPAITAR